MISSDPGVLAQLSDDALVRARDTMAERGPDGAGLWRDRSVALAHRRLAVIDPTPAGAQPMASRDGRCTLIYNGELYNEPDVRARLRETPVGPCDTATLLGALAEDWRGALDRVRGMYAFACWDASERRLLIARDPLGVKPLVYWRSEDGRTLAFASEARALLALPFVEIQPDWVAVSAYCTTIRSSLGERTLFRGVRRLAPGAGLEVRVGGEGDAISVETFTHWSSSAIDPDADGARTRELIEDSVVGQLRSDVPLCALLSGGLDSTAIASVAGQRIEGLRTFSAGARSTDGSESDVELAPVVASELGLAHEQAIVTRGSFLGDWATMVERLGTPLSTPNEVAIFNVASLLRASGCVVTLSGEGADEIFGGYDAPLRSVQAFAQDTAGAWASFGGAEAALPGWALREFSGRASAFIVASAAWMPLGAKRAAISPEVMDVVEDDRALLAWYDDAFVTAHQGAGEHGDALDAAGRLQRRVNLEGLLARLDTATMLASVEGRTPFADGAVASFAESIAMRRKTRLDDPAGAQTKLPLRDAFRGEIPEVARARAKASFPLPFEQWMDGAVDALDSGFARGVFTAPAIELVRQDPRAAFRFAWPMLNLAKWGGRWWG